MTFSPHYLSKLSFLDVGDAYSYNKFCCKIYLLENL